MKHSGRALSSAFKLIFLALLLVGAVTVVAAFVPFVKYIAAPLIGLWVLFTIFTLYFFRDPDAKVPSTPGIFVAPGHGLVDTIDEIVEPNFMDGRCHRISIFLSVIDIHVQPAPAAGKVTYLKSTPGQFVSALRTDCGDHNEHVLIGFNSSEQPGEKFAVKLIAGLIARRIVPFVKIGDDVARGERISLIQFGSRADLYFPLHYKITTKIGDKVVGGETVLAIKS